ncbi:MAG TPA: hypothetical protein VMX55_13085 [candidate division Zixibacteria bacterium]|nr:hypothetical protein [candidate division Zixibacteria bacterium]
MLIAPALFFYMISPMMIYFVSGAGSYYRNNLRENIDSLFIFSGDEEGLSDAQKEKIRDEINKKLIPQLEDEVKGLYIDSFVNRSKSNKYNLLSSFETLFLFSIIWSMFSLADFVGVIILHFTPIALDFIVIDQIVNPVNVIIFAIIFALLTILSDSLAFYSLGRLRKLMLETLPIVIHIDEEEEIKRNNYIRALSQFPIESLVGDNFLRKHSRRIDYIYQDELTAPLSEALRVYAQNQVAKQQAWRIYKPILDGLAVSEKQTAAIKNRFFDSPFYDIARGVFSYEHELQSLKTDIEYVKNRLNLWKKISEEERATALVFLFRSTEQLFKSILDRFEAPIDIYSNFSSILQFLIDKKLIDEKEEEAFNTIRKKRNTLVHQSGRIVSIKKEEIEAFLESLENVLLKVEDHFKKEIIKN